MGRLVILALLLGCASPGPPEEEVVLLQAEPDVLPERDDLDRAVDEIMFRLMERYCEEPENYTWRNWERP